MAVPNVRKQGVRRVSDRQGTGRERQIESGSGEQGIDDGPGHGGEVGEGWLLDEPQPIAGLVGFGTIRIIDFDPSIGDHELETEHGESRRESHTGQDLVETRVAFFFLVVVFHPERGDLRGWERCAQRLGGRLELDGGFGQGWRSAARTQGTGGRGRGKADRRRGRGGRCADRAQRNRGSRRRRDGGRTGNRRAHGRRNRHGGRWDSGWSIGRFQGNTDGFLLERHARRLFGEWYTRRLLGRNRWLIFVFGHARAGF